MGYLRLFRINLSRIDNGFRLILDDLEKNYRESRDAPGLAQSEIAGNEQHDNNNADNVENIVHDVFSFLRVIESPLS